MTTLAPDALLDASVARLREVVAAAEPTLTALDETSGDGDFGTNLDDGLARTTDLVARGDGPPWTVLRAVFLDEVGGTSGPLFGLLFQAVGLAAGSGTYTEVLTAGLAEGLAAIQRVGEAEVGDRTLVDALAPAVAALDDGRDAATMLAAAVDGALATASIRARRGRASYLGDRAVGSPDPGAVGVALLLSVLAEPEVGVEAAAAERARLLGGGS